MSGQGRIKREDVGGPADTRAERKEREVANVGGLGGGRVGVEDGVVGLLGRVLLV